MYNLPVYPGLSVEYCVCHEDNASNNNDLLDMFDEYGPDVVSINAYTSVEPVNVIPAHVVTTFNNPASPWNPLRPCSPLAP